MKLFPQNFSRSFFVSQTLKLYVGSSVFEFRCELEMIIKNEKKGGFFKHSIEGFYIAKAFPMIFFNLFLKFHF